MSSLLHSTTMQFQQDPTHDEKEHKLVLKKISDHEIEVDLRDFSQELEKSHYIEYICLYSIRRIVDTIYLKPTDEPRVIFDLNKINEKENSTVQEKEDWLPRRWDINQDFHAVAHCNIHGNWSDVNEEFL